MCGMNHVVLTPHATSDDQAPRWQIRHDDGSTTGPTDLDTLRRWAAEGRITATCGLSRDGQTWVPAASLAELEMDWLVLVSSDSVIGPFAFAALEVLRASGDIPADAHIFRRQTAQAAGSQGTQLVQRTITAETHRREAEAQLQQLRADLEAKDLEFQAERQQLAAETARAKAELLRRDAEVAALRDASAQLSTSSEEHQALEARLVDAERETARLRDACDDLRRQLAAATEARDAARKEAQQAHVGLREQLAETVRHAQTIRTQYEERTKRCAALADALRELAATEPLPEIPAPPVPEPVPSQAESPALAEPVPGSESPRPAADRPAAVPPLEAPRPEFQRRAPAGSAATAKPAAAKAQTVAIPDVVVEILPPERPRAATPPPPSARAGSRMPPHLATLEAQAQQELARLKATKGDAAPFWGRRKSQA